MKEERTLYFDLETFPKVGHFFGNLYETNIVNLIRDEVIACVGYRWSDEKEYNVKALPDYKLYKKEPFNDRDLVKDLHALISSADKVIGHNGDKFDVRVANNRFIHHKLEAFAKIESEDTLKQAKSRFKFTSNKLAHLAHLAGLGTKKETGGINLWLDCEKGNLKAWAKMKSYCKHDVVLLVGVHEWLYKWVTHKYNANVWNGTTWSCPDCGSPELAKWGYRFTATGKYQRFKCNKCGRESTGKTNLLENKVKVK